MSLCIFESSGGVGQVSQNGELTNPLIFSVSQQEGGILEQRLYLRSDNPLVEGFEDGRIYARDATLPDESVWITFAPDVNGAAGDYASSMTFSIPIGQELPFWIRLDVPEAQEIQVKTDISIVTDYVTVEP